MDDAMREAREWVMVPREPTPEMNAAASKVTGLLPGVMATAWKRALAAAPQPNPTERANLVGEGVREAIARIIDPYSFDLWRQCFDNPINHRDGGAEKARRIADHSYGHGRDVAFAKADAILDSLRLQGGQDDE